MHARAARSVFISEEESSPEGPGRRRQGDEGTRIPARKQAVSCPVRGATGTREGSREGQRTLTVVVLAGFPQVHGQLDAGNGESQERETVGEAGQQERCEAERAGRSPQYWFALVEIQGRERVAHGKGKRAGWRATSRWIPPERFRVIRASMLRGSVCVVTACVLGVISACLSERVR